jgi:hypothetical protein
MRRKARPTGTFISLRDAEREFAIPYHTLRRWTQRGLLPRLDSRLSGIAIRVKRADLQRLLESHLTKGGE